MKLILALVAVVAFLGATTSGKAISGPAQLRSPDDNDDDIIKCIAKIINRINWSSFNFDNNDGIDDVINDVIDDDGNLNDFSEDDVTATSIYVSPEPETSSNSQSRSAHKSVNRAANHNKGNRLHGHGKAHNSHDKTHDKAHGKGKAHGNSHAKAHAKSHEARNHNKESKVDKTNKNHQ